jgi:hypothetical protein
MLPFDYSFSNLAGEKMHEDATFPKLTASQLTGAIGVTILNGIVERELKWRFRRNHQEDDFGIDGYVDLVSESGCVLGKNFAVQIKTGPSHVVKSTDHGFLLHGQLKHLNYFLNSPLPIILVWVDDSVGRAWWVHVKPTAVRMAKAGWTILIPKSNRLDSSARTALAALAGPVSNYLPLVGRIQTIREAARGVERIFFLADRAEVEAGDVSRLKEFFEMFEAVPEMLPALQGKLILIVHGWNEDAREVYQIPEARAWFEKAERAVLGWGYYLDLDGSHSTFHTFFMCSSTTEIVGETIDRSGKVVEISLDEAQKFIEKHFDWLNEFTDKHSFALEVNKEISLKMAAAMKTWFLENPETW